MFQGEPDCWARHDDPNSSETSLGSEGLSKLFLPFLCITIIRGTWSSAEWQSNRSGQVWTFQPPCPQTFWAGSANRLLTVFTAICFHLCHNNNTSKKTRLAAGWWWRMAAQELGAGEGLVLSFFCHKKSQTQSFPARALFKPLLGWNPGYLHDKTSSSHFFCLKISWHKTCQETFQRTAKNNPRWTGMPC